MWIFTFGCFDPVYCRLIYYLTVIRCLTFLSRMRANQNQAYGLVDIVTLTWKCTQIMPIAALAGQTLMQYQLQITWSNNHFILTMSLSELTFCIQWSIQALSRREVESTGKWNSSIMNLEIVQHDPIGMLNIFWTLNMELFDLLSHKLLTFNPHCLNLFIHFHQIQKKLKIRTFIFSVCKYLIWILLGNPKQNFVFAVMRVISCMLFVCTLRILQIRSIYKYIANIKICFYFNLCIRFISTYFIFSLFENKTNLLRIKKYIRFFWCFQFIFFYQSARML